MNWAVADKDNILDVHDAYYHYQFVQSWGDQPDTLKIKQELENLKLSGAIFSLDADTLCNENYSINLNKEQELTLWSNIATDFSLCDYISYQDSDYLESVHGIQIPEYVSFGDLYSNNQIYPATLIENSPWQVLLVVDYAYPKEWFTFLPIMILSILFMLILFLVIWKFLQPIGLMKSRITSLEQGDLDSQINVRGKDELAVLSQKFNNLTREIKNLLKQKDRLLSEVSHEFRTPLAKIRLLLEMIRPKHSVNKEVMEVENKINKIDKHVDYLDSIIKNVLISDKLNMPYTNLDIENININKLIEQAVELSKNKNITVAFLDAPIIKCDVVKMSIVIRNLLDNAGKYALSKRPAEITPVFKQGVVSINVRDYGPGIDHKLISTITKPYVRGNNKSQPGFGLGLSICKKVMESHGGFMKIKNMPDKGCSFVISWDSSALKINK